MTSLARSVLRAGRVVSSRAAVRPLSAASVSARVPRTVYPAFARGYATGPDPVSSTDPKLSHAQSLLEDGTRALEEGDLSKAKAAYQGSIDVMPTSGAYFNLGVVEYQLSGPQAAIDAWKQSIALEPSADAYTNVGSAYMMVRPPQPAEAIKALTAAMEIAPNDPEIQFNLAAVLESTDQLETALTLYRKAHAGGIERAAANIRNIGGKIVAKKAKEQEEGSEGDKQT